MEIFPSIHRIQVPIPDSPLVATNVYYVRSPAGDLLIDTGWDCDEAFDALQAGIHAAGGSWDDLCWVVLTHTHPDHIGLLRRVAQHARPEVFIHPAEYDLVVRMNAAPADVEAVHREFTECMAAHGAAARTDWQLHRRQQADISYAPGLLTEHLVEDGQLLPLAGLDLQVVWTPGHTPGHICLYEAGRRLVFIGDHVLVSVNPNIGKDRLIEDPLGDYLASLRKVGALEVEHVLTAHGPSFEGLKDRVDYLLEHHEARTRDILGALEGGPRSAYSVARAIPWTDKRVHFDQLPLFAQPVAFSQLLAHLDHLEKRGLVGHSEAGGRVRYGPAGFVAPPG